LIKPILCLLGHPRTGRTANIGAVAMFEGKHKRASCPLISQHGAACIPWRRAHETCITKITRRSLLANQFIAAGVTAGFANKLSLRPTGATKTIRDFNPVTAAQAIRRKGPCFGPIKDLQTGRKHLHKPLKFSQSLSP
jgi:hypothetical protein